LNKSGFVRVDADSATDDGTLLFYIGNLNIETFVNAGLQMQGEERWFPPLSVRLVVIDTNGSSADATFELPEA
jgi:hypothetical protein